MGLKFNFFQAAKKGKLLRRHVDKGKDIDKMYRIHIPFAYSWLTCLLSTTCKHVKQKLSLKHNVR